MRRRRKCKRQKTTKITQSIIDELPMGGYVVENKVVKNEGNSTAMNSIMSMNMEKVLGETDADSLCKQQFSSILNLQICSILTILCSLGQMSIVREL